MSTIFDLAISNLLSPIILFFILGFLAAMAKSDLSIPEAMAKAMALYLLLAIGFKGGVGIATSGATFIIIPTLLAGIVLSASIPFIAYALLVTFTGMDRLNSAAISGHYGSISVVTFVAAIAILESRSIDYGGYMVAVASIMEVPAIITALWLAQRHSGSGSSAPWGEILLNGSVVLLIGALVIGWITGPEGMAEVESFIVSPFKGVLCLFLLDMGLVAGRGILAARDKLRPTLILFGLVMPPIGAALGLLASLLLGLETGSAVLLMTLCASASYIAVPAAMRVALPRADPSIYLTLSLGVTFPFNLTIGIPLYLMATQMFLS